MLTVILDLGVPASVFAEGETPQEASDKICAFLYQINGSARDLELVFQNDPNPDPMRILVGSYGVDPAAADYHFASKEYHKKQYYVDGNNNPAWDWADQSYVPLPWYADSNNSGYIKTITFKEEIKPLSIASWFAYCSNVNQINGLDKLNLSNCEDMSYAFYVFANNNNTLTSLDLSCLNQGNSSTGNVRQADFFFRSAKIQTLILKGMDLSGIGRVHTDVKTAKGASTVRSCYISDLCDFIYYSHALTKIDFEGVNLSHIRQLKSFLYDNRGLEEIDLSNLASGPVDAYTIEYLCRNHPALKTVKLGSAEHPFEVATNLTTNTIPYAANSSLPDNQIASMSTRNITLVYLGNMFLNCANLESVSLEHFRTTTNVQLQCNGVFDGCAALTKVDHFGNLFKDNYLLNASAWQFKRIFNGCTSLTEIDMSENMRALGEGELIFANCSSLKTLDLSGLGKQTSDAARAATHTYRKLCAATPSGNDAALYSSYNIYQNCEELTEVIFSPYYPEQIGSGYNIPPDKTWVKVDNPAPGEYQDYENAHSGYANAYSEAGNTALTKNSEELFGDFKPEYAGRWVGISRIVLDGNGGSPDKQALENNAKGLPLNYDPESITDPERTGFSFAGWYADKTLAIGDPDNQQLPVPNGENAAAWAYYARWYENTYSLTLDSNGGGTVPNSVTEQSIADHTGIDVSKITIDPDRKAIHFNNIRYTEYVELNKGYFASNDGDSILTGWGDRPNGTGKVYGVNESLSKLSSENGTGVTLYAQWHTPHAIITFDVNDGDDPSAPATPVSPISYESADAPYGELPESSREGYSFVYWYYTTEDPTTHAITEHPVTSTDTVGMSRTLYAKWMKNPQITFTCEETAGEFVDHSQKQTKVGKYNQAIGILPVPHNGKAAFKGWYDNLQGTGNPITSDTLAKGDTTYYALWGYKLEIDVDGGSFSDGFTGYPVQDDESMIVTLHLPSKPNATFGGWFTDPDFAEEHRVTTGDLLHLSQTNKIYAQWIKDICTVSLNPNGGDVSSDSIQVHSGHTIGELPTPVKEGCDFLGWYEALDGGGLGTTRYTATSEITGDVTLKAKWAEKNLSVRFKAEGGSFYDTGNGDDIVVNVAEGGTICCPPGVSKTGYFFDGWYTGENGTGTKLTA